MKNCIIENLKYMIYSKKILLFIILSLGLMFGLQFLNYANIKSKYEDYNQQYQRYIKDGFNPEKESESEYYEIENGDDESDTIENPLAYYKEMLLIQVKSFLPCNSTVQLQEISFLFIPIVISIISVVITSSDRNGKVFKMRRIRHSHKIYILSRKTTIYIISLFVGILTFLVGKITNYILYSYAVSHMNLTPFISTGSNVGSGGVLIARWIIIVVYAVVVIELSTSVSNIVKNTTVGIVGVYVIMFVCSFPTKYDLRKSINYLYDKYFDMNGIVNIVPSKENITVQSSMLVIGIVVFVSLIADYLVEKRRSGFNG